MKSLLPYLTLSLSQLFSGSKVAASPSTPERFKDVRSLAKTKRHNRENVADHKWDFVERSRAGHGWFRNRTTGEIDEKKIANPKSTKNNPVRELSIAAQKHFGLTAI